MNFIGIEIGGTKLQLTIADAETLQPIEEIRLTIVPANGAVGILHQLIGGVRELLTRHNATMIGVGFGGPVDGEQGVVRTSHQVAGWDGFPLVDWCREQFGLPAVIRNDCDCGAFAEAILGAGHGYQSVFYVTVGSGIGGGLVVNRSLRGTSRPAFAEIGHLRPSPENTSPRDTVEAVASGFGIAQKVRERMFHWDPADWHHQDLMGRCHGDVNVLNTSQIAEAAAQGNLIAQEALGNATKVLGWAIAQVITIAAPQIVVVGGGVSMMPAELFFEPLKARVAEYVFPPLAASYEVTQAKLGESVVVTGALLMAQQAAHSLSRGASSQSLAPL